MGGALGRRRVCSGSRLLLATLCGRVSRSSFEQGCKGGSELTSNPWPSFVSHTSTGASVREFLLHQGIPDAYEHIQDKETLPPTVKSLENDSAPWSRRTYLHFLSSQPCSESQSPTGHVYGSSVPLCTALHPNQDLLLAWGVDGQRLDSTHGYPLRAALPGHVAARWTKWLSMLRISFYEDDSPPMTLDYKLLEPPKGASEEERKRWIDSMMGEGKDEKKREAEVAKAKPLMRLGVGSGVSEPQDDDKIELNDKGEMTAEGYAVGTEGE